MTEISIIIPTYQRPEGLARAVASCLAQEGVDGSYEIVVVDNNPDAAARFAIEAMACTCVVPLRYVAEPRPGISHARNAGVAASAGRYLVFIDDDQEADPSCLAGLLAAVRRFDADVVFGRIEPLFPLAAGLFEPYARAKFTRDYGLHTGMPIPAGSPMRGMPGICNTIIDKEQCFTDPEPFKPWLGFQGGEDTLFFRQLLWRGRRMVWCEEAVVRETIPADRLTPHYLLRRAFNNGQISASTWSALDPPSRTRMTLMMMAGCVQMALFWLPAVALRALHNPRWLSFSARVAGGLGKLLCHPRIHLKIYR